MPQLEMGSESLPPRLKMRGATVKCKESPIAETTATVWMPAYSSRSAAEAATGAQSSSPATATSKEGIPEFLNSRRYDDLALRLAVHEHADRLAGTGQRE